MLIIEKQKADSTIQEFITIMIWMTSLDLDQCLTMHQWLLNYLFVSTMLI